MSDPRSEAIYIHQHSAAARAEKQEIIVDKKKSLPLIEIKAKGVKVKNEKQLERANGRMDSELAEKTWGDWNVKISWKKNP